MSYVSRMTKETTMNAMSFRAAVAMMAALTAGLALWLLTVGTAHANLGFTLPPMTPPATATTIAGCGKLPVSQIEFCKSQVGWSEIGSARVAIDQAASARTASEVAACRNLPVSTRFMCENQAGYGQAVPQQNLSSSQEAALRAADERYHAAVAACKAGPPSAEGAVACLSQAGQDTRLAAATTPTAPTG
jgi:hypothetical protein